MEEKYEMRVSLVLQTIPLTPIYRRNAMLHASHGENLCGANSRRDIYGESMISLVRQNRNYRDA